MKKITFILLMLVSGTMLGQTNSENVAVSADIVSPIVVTPGTPMNFGKISNASAITVILDTNNAISGTTNLGTTTPTSADFTVNAADGYTYTVTLSSSIELVHDTDNTQKMTVDSFTTFPDVSGTLTGNGNDQEYKVGASLGVAAGQTTGTYSGTFNVTANYN